MAKANAVTLMKDGEELEKKQLEEEAARPESDKALDLVYSDEGFSETAYPDPYSPRMVAKRNKQKDWETPGGISSIAESLFMGQRFKIGAIIIVETDFAWLSIDSTVAPWVSLA